MELELHKTQKGTMAELKASYKLVQLQDFVDLIGNAGYYDARLIIVHIHQLPDGFLDLKTKFAGEVLQKFSTYNQKLAIVGDYSKVQSKSWHAFVVESNRIGHITFWKTIEKVFSK